MLRFCSFVLLFSCFAASVPLFAAAPGDIIINEVYFNATDGPTNDVEAVELLVVTDNVDLTGIQISDRDVWNAPSEEQCTLQDLGQGFLRSVPSGTLIVIYDGNGTDDTDASDFVMRFWARSSLYCNVAPTGRALQLGDHGDNLHLIQGNKQLDFVKYRASDRPGAGKGEPGNLNWEKGREGYIDIGPYRTTRGFRYLGDKADLNDFPVAWQVYSETYLEQNNLGEPNGGRNTTWIEQLRSQHSKPAKKD